MLRHRAVALLVALLAPLVAWAADEIERLPADRLHYPDLTGRKRAFNCEEWAQPCATPQGKPDYHRNYMVWWFRHLPQAPGVNADGRLNNWWEYVYNFNAYDPDGKPLPKGPPVDPATQPTGVR